MGLQPEKKSQPKITTNSLTSRYNNNRDFEAIDDENQALLNENKISEKDEFSKLADNLSEDDKQTAIKKADDAKNKTSNGSTNSTVRGTKSLFSRNALIDYGRYINNDGTVFKDWKEYKKVTNKDIDNKNNNNTEFLLNNNRAINQPILWQTENIDDVDGLSIDNIIEWSSKYPALKLRYQDFAYCKRLGYFPNNRMIVLRRFKSGVPDNLFDYETDTGKSEFNCPLSTMVTWWTDEEDIGKMRMTFKENWSTYSQSILNTFSDAKADFNVSGKESMLSKLGLNIGESGLEVKKFSGATSDTLINLFLQSASQGNERLIRDDGFPYTQSVVGNGGFVNDAMRKDTNGNGLASEIQFELKEIENSRIRV